jgi:hypothetical protein
MHKKFSFSIILFIIFFILPVSLLSQSSDDYLPNKPGKWFINKGVDNWNSNNDEIAFEKNLTVAAEWFHKNIPLLANPTGFDLQTTFYGIWDDDYKKRECNYALRSTMDFAFQLFFNNADKNAKRTLEPPHYEVSINNTESGHGSNFNEVGYIVGTDDASIEVELEKARAEVNDFFLLFPLTKKFANGVELYGDRNLIIYNSDRPPFWIPVTVRDVIEKKIAYYKIKEGKNPFVYTYLKDFYDKMTPEELNSPAYKSGDAVVGVSSDSTEALQIMRFNKDYWDRSLPKSAIQFISLIYRQSNEFDMEEHIKNNGYPDYGQVLINELPLNRLTELIARKK